MFDVMDDLDSEGIQNVYNSANAPELDDGAFD